MARWMRQGAAVVTAKGEAGRIRGDGQSDTAAAAAATSTKASDKDSRERPIQSLLSIQLPQLTTTMVRAVERVFTRAGCKPSLLRIATKVWHLRCRKLTVTASISQVIYVALCSTYS